MAISFKSIKSELISCLGKLESRLIRTSSDNISISSQVALSTVLNYPLVEDRQNTLSVEIEKIFLEKKYVN